MLRNCQLFDGVRKVLIKKGGRVVSLPATKKRKSYRLPERYSFFNCSQNQDGDFVIYAKTAEDSEIVEYAFSEESFPETDGSNSVIPEANCKEFPGSIFKPCICASEVPEDIKFRPSYSSCGGDAAAILEGKFASSFSIALRDSQNRDRWPASGYNGCSDAEVDAGLAKCSAFKCQSTIRTPKQFVCCFGEPGNSSIMAPATRLTIKLKDIPGSTADPLLRVCLPDFDPVYNLN